MGSNIEKKLVKQNSYEYKREKEYIKENLLFYIDKEKKVERRNICGKWRVSEDRQTLLRYQYLDYIVEHFNLKELYVIFFEPLDNGFSCNNFEEARKDAIENINSNNSFTHEEAKRIKRKVWDMNPILFDLISEFIYSSELFWDSEIDDFVFPDSTSFQLYETI